MSRVRKPAVAGSFYDGDAARLRDHVDQLLRQADEVDLKGTIRGLVSPHAGYVYSGLAAAVGYKALRGLEYEAVVMVGPSHREFFDGVSLYSGDAYRTPLGDVPVHAEIRDALAGHSSLLKPCERNRRQL